MKKFAEIFLLNLLSLILLAGCFWLARDFWLSGGEERYAELFPTEINRQNAQPEGVALNEPLVLSFSVPVDGEKYVQETRLEPFQRSKIKYEGTSRTLTLSPLEEWIPETEYVLVLPEAKNNRWAKIESQKITFATRGFPQVEKIYPLDNAEDILLDMESPIRVELDQPAEKFDLSFSLEPDQELIVQAEEGNQVFKALPSQPLIPGQQYQLEITARWKGDQEKQKKIFQSSFRVLPEKPVAWEKDLALRAEQAKKYTRARSFADKYIDINLENQIMVIFEKGRAVDAFAISSGQRGMETPKGEHQIYNKAARAWSKKYGLYMPYWMAILADGSVGIHELPEWPGGYKEGAFHLGIPVSHGCVRLGVGSAQRVYEWAEIGTPVIVH